MAETYRKIDSELVEVTTGTSTGTVDTDGYNNNSQKVVVKFDKKESDLLAQIAALTTQISTLTSQKTAYQALLADLDTARNAI